jgi:hypothetical protein
MIDVMVTGGTKRQRELVESIALYCVHKLMPRKRKIDINIKLDKVDTALGYCYEEWYGSYCIEVEKRQTLRRLLETVAHEMVHVKQYARKEINGRDCWYGKYINTDKTEYWDLPWEIEAHGREVGLFTRWASEMGYAGKSWAQDPLEALNC